MALNRPIMVAGDFLRKEGLSNANLIPGQFVMRQYPNARFIVGINQIFTIVDYTAANGIAFDDTAYAAGDQVTVVVPYPGAEATILVNSSTNTIAAGSAVYVGATDGMAGAGSTSGTYIGVALEDFVRDPAKSTNRVLVELCY